MADPKISLQMRTDAQTTEGEMAVKAGTSLEVEVDEWGAAAVEVDYSSEDKIKITVDGKLSLKRIGADSLKMEGGVERDLFAEQTTMNGKLELVIDKRISASVDIKQAPTTTSVRGLLTVRF
ncbi:hypothetical protein [Haliangium ochraceum]|uniref:Uncharacterized protein n=1 Tax=Haliangium ochraceum (strain DSM 14365 / JCM 11303 / SMP-2) TaxID=502025 RepID=D0LIY5_HALO1|nr:hypothetical protein [Haliangium ochraceum]ACY13014.1 hypothetical protein Hoch_0373 [Haliangium ochraceum DSM 14365]